MLALALSLLVGMLIGLLPGAGSMVLAMIAFGITLFLAGLTGGLGLTFLAVASASVLACNLGLAASLLAPVYFAAPRRPA